MSAVEMSSLEPAAADEVIDRDMIVYDREGELYLRKKSFMGNTSWHKYYAVLCRLRRCLYLFEHYYLYERHLVEVNGYENEYHSWSLRLSLHHSSLFVCSTYFTRSCVFELSGPEGVSYLCVKAGGSVSVAAGEANLRGWIGALSRAGVLLKSDEKPLLLWRPPGPPGDECFLYTRASSTLPAHDAAQVHSWESLSASLTWSAAALMRRSAVVVPGTGLLSTGGNATPMLSPEGRGVGLGGSEVVQQLLGSEYTSDHSFGKHGYLQKLGRSLFARLYSDSSASTDPASPFYDPRLAMDQSVAATAHNNSSMNHWVTRFYRTVEAASGRACLVAFKDREQTAPSIAKRKHVLQLFQARVFDLQAIRNKVEQECRAQAEHDERERWRRKAETVNASLAPQQQQRKKGAATSSGGSGGRSFPSVPSQSGGEDIYAHERGPQRKARLVAFSALVQSSFVSHKSFPEPLPSFAPAGEGDFAIYVKTPQPKYMFFRATTAREKKKWVDVLRNLAADQTPQPDSEIIPPPKSSSRKSAADSQQQQPNLSVLAPDEREVHVVRRDFYSILGVDSAVSTEVLTKHYRDLQAELRARMIPTSPLHNIVPDIVVEEEADDEQEKKEEAKAEKKRRKQAGKDQQQTAQKPNHNRMFSFDVNPASAQAGSAAASASPAVAASAIGTGTAATTASVADGSSSSSVSAPADASAAPTRRRLTHAQIQERLRYKLGELREVWRILKDPVRRCQYDERREALGLAELGALPPPPAPTHPHAEASVAAPAAAAASDRLDMSHRSLLPKGPGASAAALVTAASMPLVRDPIDLQEVLKRAETAAKKLPRPPPKTNPPPPALAAPTAKKDDKEEKYPALTPAGGGGRKMSHGNVYFKAAALRALQYDLEEEKRTSADSSTALPVSSLMVVAPVSAQVPSAPLPLPPPQAPPLSAAERTYLAPSMQAPLQPGDAFSITWEPEWGKRGSRNTITSSGAAMAGCAPAPAPTPTAAAPGTAVAPSSATMALTPPSTISTSSTSIKPAAPLITTATAAPAPPDARVKLELCLRKGIGFLSRVKLIKLLDASAPDSGSFEFVLPFNLEPRKGYFVRLTLLPPPDAAATSKSSASSSSPLLVTESPSFEVVPFEKPETYSQVVESLQENPLRTPPRSTTPAAPQ